MHIMHHAARLSVGIAAALAISACADDAVTTALHPQVTSFASTSFATRGGFEFKPLSSSFACTVSGQAVTSIDPAKEASAKSR